MQVIETPSTRAVADQLDPVPDPKVRWGGDTVATSVDDEQMRQRGKRLSLLSALPGAHGSLS
ncbi:MAG: hypothetical protein R2856_39120 [Caldilineaceae bacterium]